MHKKRYFHIFNCRMLLMFVMMEFQYFLSYHVIGNGFFAGFSFSSLHICINTSSVWNFFLSKLDFSNIFFIIACFQSRPPPPNSERFEKEIVVDVFLCDSKAPFYFPFVLHHSRLGFLLRLSVMVWYFLSWWELLLPSFFS